MMKSDQPDMRRLMMLAEARMPKAKQSLSHEERVAQEQARQAHQLGVVKQQATELKAKTMKVAEEVTRHVWELHGWEQDWVNEVRLSINAIRKQYQDAAKENHEYQLEDNPAAVMQPVNLLECVTEGLSAWWDQKKDTLDWGDGQYRLDDYMDAHPRTEMSEDMSRLRSEHDMLRHIQYLNGGFGSASEMDHTLSHISMHCHTLQNNFDNGWSHAGDTVLQIVRKGIPLILFYCKLVTAIPAVMPVR